MNKVLDAALLLLARREYSAKELASILLNKYESEEVATVITRCLEAGYLSNERFTESRIRHRIQQGYGPLWIQQELRRSGIDNELIDSYLSKEDDFWAERASQIIEKKFSNKTNDFLKMQRYMYQKGFLAEHIQQALRIVDRSKL